MIKIILLFCSNTVYRQSVLLTRNIYINNGMSWIELVFYFFLIVNN